MVTCELCGEEMPKGEEMLRYHGYSGPCPEPKTVKTRAANPPYTSETWQAPKPGDGDPCPKCGARVQGCPEGEYCSWTECDYVA